jgi:uncharacterized membrane protein HdeD (DUF308 family)
MDRQGFNSRKTWLGGMIAVCFLLAGYLCLLAVLSIWIGLRSAPQPGFWVPVLAGFFCFLLVLWALFRLTRFLRSQMTEEGIVSVEGFQGPNHG